MREGEVGGNCREEGMRKTEDCISSDLVSPMVKSPSLEADRGSSAGVIVIEGRGEEESAVRSQRSE